MGKYDDILEKYRKQRDGDTSAEQKQKQTQGNDYSSVLDAYHKSKEGQTQTQGQTQPQVQHSEIYEQRKARQDKASEAAKKAWWEVLGLAAQDASAATTGQQRTLTAEEGRQRATAGANLAAATKENREANKIVDWDGRKELLKQYEASGGTDMETREKLRQGDIKAGNLDVDGDMAYTLDETVQRMGTAGLGNIVSGVYKTILTNADLYGKSQAMQGPTEDELITGFLTGQDPTAAAKQRRDAYNSKEYRDFMNTRYGEAAKIAETAKRDLQIAEENKAPIVKAGIDVGENMLEMGFDGGVAMLTGGSALIPLAIRVFGNAALEAQEAGASLEQQALYGLSSAALEVATEKLGDGLGGLYGKGFTQNATEHMIQRLASTGPGMTFLRFISGLNSEGMEEVISGIFEPALKSIYNGKTPWQNYSEFEWGDLLYNYALGAAAAIFGGVSNIASGGNAYANAQLMAANAAQAQTDSNFGWMLPDSMKEQAREEQFDRMFVSGTPNTSTRSETPAQKPEMKAAKTPAQRRVEAIINAAATQDQLIQSLQFFQSQPALDAAFEELTGGDIDAYLAEASQEAAGGVLPQGDNPAPAAPENAQQQAPVEFNSVNDAGESSERGVTEYLYGYEDEEADYNDARLQQMRREAPAQNRNMRDASDYYSAAGVDFITGDSYNEGRGQKVSNTKLGKDAYVAQQLRNGDYTGKAWYDDAIDTARMQIREDGRNASRIADGQDEWGSLSPKQRAQILSEVTGSEYYVSDNQVVRAKRRVASDSDERSSRFYEQEMRDAGVKDVSQRELQLGDMIGKAKGDVKVSDREAPPEYVGRLRGDYSAEELSEIERENRRRDAQRHRENTEAWREREYGGPLVTNPRLGAPNNSLRSDVLQRIMRNKQKLADLVKGEGNFKGWHVDRRFDMLRSMYPDADWRIDAETNSIYLPGDPVLNPSAPSDRWQRDTTKPKNTTVAPKGVVANENKAKPQQTKSSGVTYGTQRRVSASELERARSADGRIHYEELERASGVGYNSDQRRTESNGAVYKREQGESRRTGRNAGARAVEAESNWRNAAAIAETRGARLIGHLTKSMAKVTDFMNRLGCPVTHMDVSEASSKSSYNLGLSGAFLGWGYKTKVNKYVVAVHEAMHYFIASKNKTGFGGNLVLEVFSGSGINRATIKSIGQVFRSTYEDKYSRSLFGKSYSELTKNQRITVGLYIGEEIFNSACSSDYSRFRSAGMTVGEFQTLRRACLDAAIDSGIITPEQREIIDSVLTENMTAHDDYLGELPVREETNATSGSDIKAKATDYVEAEKLDKKQQKEEAQQRGDYRLGPKAAAKLDAEAHANTTTIDPYDDGGIDVDADDFELPYRTDNKEMQRRDDLNRQSEVEQRQQPKAKGETPESSKQYLQQNRLRKSDFENRETERAGTEAQFKAEEAQAREEINHDEAYDRAQIEAQQLADAKKAYGEENQKKLSELAEKGWSLVGNSRVTENGNVGFTYRNEGGRDLESFAHVLREFAAGKQTFQQYAEAYRKLGSEVREGNGRYFFDESFGKDFETLAYAFEKGDVIRKDGTLDPDFANHVANLTQRVVHRMEIKQKQLKLRSDLAEAFSGDKKTLHGKTAMLVKAFKALNRSQLRPSTAFKMLASYDRKNGRAWYQLADKARDSVRDYINTFQTAQDYLQEVTQHKDWEKFSTGKITVKNVVPGLDYEGGRLSANAAVSFLKMLETNGAYDHIIRNGIIEMPYSEAESYKGQMNNGLGDTSGYSKQFDPISPEVRSRLETAKTAKERTAAYDQAVAELDALKSALRAEIEAVPVAKAAYDASFAPLNFLKKALNKTSRKVWGADVAVQDKFYWPLEAGGKRLGGELLNSQSYGLDQYRNVQERTGDRGVLMVRPFTDVLQNYIRSASHWAAYQELSDTLNTLSKNFNGTDSITQLLNNTVGKEWSGWLSDYEADLNGTRGKDKGFAGKALGTLRGNLAQASLSLNPGVALKQAPSGLNFMGVLDADIVTKRFFGGALRTRRNIENNPLIQAVQDRTRMLANRGSGYNIVEGGEATEMGRKNWITKVTNKLPNWITATDYRTVANGLLACADQVDRYIKHGVEGYAGLTKGSDAYYSAIADLFERATIDTQPIYNKEYRADLLRTDNEFVRTLAMFRTQQTQNYNNLVESVGEWNAAKRSGDAEAIKAAGKKMAGTIGGQIASAIVFSMLDAAAKMMLHKKKQYEDEEGNIDWGLMATKTGYNTLNTLASTSFIASKLSPWVLDMATTMLNKKNPAIPKSGMYYSTEDGVLSLVDDMLTAAKSFTEKPSAKTAKSLALAVASISGMPLRNAYGIVSAIAMYGIDATGLNVRGEDDLVNYLDGYYNATDSSKGKQAMLRAISLNKKGNGESVDAIMASLEPDALKSAKQQLKDSFIAGDIDSMTYRDMLEKYFGMSRTEAWDLWKTTNEAKKFSDTKAGAFSSEEESKAFDKTMSKLTTTTDPTGKERFAEISRLGLNEEDTDTFVKKYMTETFSKNYDALRSIKIKPNDAARIVSSIDENESGSLSQDEVYDYLLTYPSSKKTVDALWKASGWKTSLDKYAEDYAKQPANILASFGMSKAEAKRVAKQLNYDGKNDITQEDFFNYLKKHPDQEEALKAVFAVKWPKSDYESKKRKYS